MELPTDGRTLKRITRRNLLKLSPVLLAGAFAVPRLRDSLLQRGLEFSDWASSKWFRADHLAPGGTHVSPVVLPEARGGFESSTSCSFRVQRPSTAPLEESCGGSSLCIRAHRAIAA
jgi:hypothetical protein